MKNKKIFLQADKKMAVKNKEKNTVTTTDTNEDFEIDAINGVVVHPGSKQCIRGLDELFF